MRIPASVVVATLAVAVLLPTGAITACRGSDPDARAAMSPDRIVSLAPSITETLFALGLGDRVVGVTRYCEYPPDVSRLPAVGGHLDPSYEAIVLLEPDLVILHRAHVDGERRLRSFGIGTLRVDQDDVAGVLRSVSEIAQACGVPERGEQLRSELRRQLTDASVERGDDPPTALVVVSRTVGTGEIGTVWVAGTGSYHDDILRLAGAVNAIGDTVVAHPELTAEGLLAIDPDVILDVVPDLDRRAVDRETALSDWSSLGTLRAVRTGRVTTLSGSDLVVPGPRVVSAVQRFAAAIHSPTPTATRSDAPAPGGPPGG